MFWARFPEGGQTIHSNGFTDKRSTEMSQKTFTFFLSLSHTFFAQKGVNFVGLFVLCHMDHYHVFCWNRKKYLNPKSLKFPLMSYLKISKNGPKTKDCKSWCFIVVLQISIFLDVVPCIEEISFSTIFYGLYFNHNYTITYHCFNTVGLYHLSYCSLWPI